MTNKTVYSRDENNNYNSLTDNSTQYTEEEVRQLYYAIDDT
jgi:hypothetical protein